MTSEVAEVRYVENKELTPADFGLEGKLQDRPQEKPKAQTGSLQLLAKQYLNDPNASDNYLLYKQMHNVAFGGNVDANAGKFALDYILQNQPGSNDWNLAVNLWKEVKQQPGYVANPQKDVEVYKKLIKAEPDNYQNYIELLKLTRGPPTTTIDEYIGFLNKAVELAPKEEKYMMLWNKAVELGEIYVAHDRNKKYLKLLKETGKQMIAEGFEKEGKKQIENANWFKQQYPLNQPALKKK